MHIAGDIIKDTGEQAMQVYKRYVDVILRHHKNGEVQPLYVCWDDGLNYKIEKIIGKARRASPAGGCGIRFACMIHGQQRNLYLEKDKWFIETCKP